jgi:hypothetical protein
MIEEDEMVFFRRDVLPALVAQQIRFLVARYSPGDAKSDSDNQDTDLKQDVENFLRRPMSSLPDLFFADMHKVAFLSTERGYNMFKFRARGFPMPLHFRAIEYDQEGNSRHPIGRAVQALLMYPKVVESAHLWISLSHMISPFHFDLPTIENASAHPAEDDPRLDSFEIDVSAKTIVVNGPTYSVTKQSLDLLLQLARCARAGRAGLSNAELAEILWPGSVHRVNRPVRGAIGDLKNALKKQGMAEATAKLLIRYERKRKLWKLGVDRLGISILDKQP